jgi:hypothetical protein
MSNVALTVSVGVLMVRDYFPFADLIAADCFPPGKLRRNLWAELNPPEV